jgi:hypothetical protein
MRNRCHHMQRQLQLVSDAVSHGRCIQQRDGAYIGQDIIEPPLLVREERIDEPIEHQQHLDGLLQGDRSQPKDTGGKRNNKGQQQRTQCAITEKWASRPRYFRISF